MQVSTQHPGCASASYQLRLDTTSAWTERERNELLAPGSERPSDPWTQEWGKRSLRGRRRRWVVGAGRVGGVGTGGLIDRGERQPGCSERDPGREFPCQWAHLTASLMDHGYVPQGPDGIQWSARWQLVKGGQASCIMEAGRTTPQADCCTDVEVLPSLVSILQGRQNINCRLRHKVGYQLPFT